MKLLLVQSLCLCLSLFFLVGGIGISHAGSAPADTEVVISTGTTDPFEILFQVGLEELRKGNYPAAVSVFESLAKKSGSPRIRLELARALFLDRRYRESEQLFEELLRQPDFPWAVQENIRAYLDEIDAALGFVKFGLSLVSDSNPRNFTDSRQIRIAGQPLSIIPPEDNKTIVGLRYSLNAARALDGNGALTAYLNASYSDFESSQFDRWSADAGLFLAFRSIPKFKLRAGLEQSFYDGHHLYAFPYTGLIFIPDPVLQFRMNSELKVGLLRVPKARYLDATNLSLTTKVVRKITDSVQSSADIYLEKSMADEDAYSYYGGSLGIRLSFDLFRDWSLQPFASIGRRVYAAKDPLFAETRRDTREIAGLGLKNNRLKIFGHIPTLEVQYEENTSDITYYSYDKFSVLLSFF